MRMMMMILKDQKIQFTITLEMYSIELSALRNPERDLLTGNVKDILYTRMHAGTMEQILDVFVFFFFSDAVITNC